MPTTEFTELDHSNPFTLDNTDPFTYFDTLKSSQLEPEKRLVLAILADAVNCLQLYKCCEPCPKYKKKKRCEYHDAVMWILSEEEDWIFSFNNVCETLKRDPEYLRKGLVAHIQKLRELPQKHLA